MLMLLMYNYFMYLIVYNCLYHLVQAKDSTALYMYYIIYEHALVTIHAFIICTTFYVVYYIDRRYKLCKIKYICIHT